ncbi:DUF3772 domain-containing protein [Thalassospira australica]|uniref:DUF3772 domain-containing protein n=1 Tax=Thalassospira australica TaxID=1528106 RepID=UPI00051A67C6|nr:DUF3772 domain-containing protein [Thalassospira australica]
MTSVRQVIAGLAICLFAMTASLAVSAQEGENRPDAVQKIELENAQSRVAEWESELDDLEDVIASEDVTNSRVADSRDQIESIQLAINALRSRADERLQRFEAALGKLGKPPEEGKKEVPAVARERERIDQDIARVGGLVKQLELVNFRASELSDQLAGLARERFTRRVLGRAEVPLDPAIWGQAWGEIVQLPSMVQARYANIELSDDVADELLDIAPGLVLLTFIVIAALIGGEVVVLRYVPARWNNAPEEDRVSLVSGTRFLFTAMVPGIALLIAYGILDSRDTLLTGAMGNFIHQCFAAALFLLFVGAAVRSVHSPFAPTLRRSGTTMQGARVVGGCSLAIALIFAFDMVLLQGATTLGTSLDIALVQSITNVLVISVLLFVLSLGVFWQHDAQDRHAFWSKIERRSRRGFKAVAILMPVLMALGYVALARFILENLMMALAFLSCYWLLRAYCRALMHTYLVRPESSEDSTVSDAVHGTLYFWLRVLIDVVMFSIAVPVAVMIFTDIAWVDLILAVQQAFIGIQVGGIHFSLRTILIAALMFVIVLAVMRFFQRMLSTRVLPNTKLDQGLQHSVSAIFGYAGICLAILLAVSAAGLDLSNLAIIAGAISVGIGFGMQSIVNNFVSGLILLVERPIKVGDWIVVGADQGFVKDIRVRATEIETFDRSSIVIPNSELISNRVLNWTLKERSGRGIIKIGVSYGADIDKVRDILFEMADKRREILSYPAPQVVFMDFGASSLDFELRYFLRDIGDVVVVGSSIRFELVQRFREEGIEIPFPQRDLNLRDVDKLTDAIRDAGKGAPPRPAPVPVPDISPEPAGKDSQTDDSSDMGADQKAAPPSAAKDISRDRDASSREIPDAGGEGPDDPGGDAPR